MRTRGSWSPAPGLGSPNPPGGHARDLPPSLGLLCGRPPSTVRALTRIGRFGAVLNETNMCDEEKIAQLSRADGTTYPADWSFFTNISAIRSTPIFIGT
jgi:hypothetical protein